MPTTPPSTSTNPHSPSSSSSSLVMTKRLKPTPPGTPFPGFRPGNIIELSMRNFLTFSETLFRPGPRMNLILGPNGAGKSTIVSAVCIVFGGAPKLLGRHHDLASFVKHGENHAEISVTLYDPECRGQMRKVRRVFDTDGKSTFFIDGKKVPAREVQLEINDKYDIQLDNLSQFMPQERITEFTNLSNDELLEITVRSLGGEQKVKEFAELSRWDQAASSGQDALSKLMNSIERLQSQQDDAAGEVEAFKEQEKLKERAEVLKRFVPNLELAAMKKYLKQDMNSANNMEADIDKLRQDLASADSGPINERRQQLRAAKETEKNMRTTLKQKDGASNTLVNKMDTIIMELDSKQKEISDVGRKARQQQKGIEAAEDKLARAKDMLRNQGDVKEAHLQQQIDSLSRQKNELRDQQMSASNYLNRMESEIEDVSRAIRHHNHALKNIASIRDQRIHHLARQSQQQQLFDCARLVREMKRANAFRGNVYGPVAAEIEVSNEYHQRIMEHCLRGFLMTAFVSEYSSDSKLLLQECRRRFNGWTPDMITSPTTREDEIDIYAIQNQLPMRPIDERLKDLGIDAVISEIYSAPQAVKAALNAQANLHNIHVGSRRAESDNAECSLRGEEGVLAWYTPTRRCQLQGSRYHSGPKNLSIDYQFEYISGKIFSGRMDTAERERARLASLIRQDEERLSDAKQRLEDGKDESAELKQKYQIAAKEFDQVMDHKKKRVGLQAQVIRLKNHVETLRARAAALDIDKEKATLNEQIQRLEQSAHDTAVRVSAALQDLVDSMARHDQANLTRIEASHNLAREEAQHSTLRDEIKDKEKELEEFRNHIRAAKAQYKEKRESRSQFSPQEREQYGKLFEELEMKYGDNVDGLRDEIVELEGRAQGLTTGGDRILAEYKHRQAQLNKMNKDLEKEREEQERQQSRLRERKEAFLAWLRSGIDKMRVKFSSLYRRLGCSGDLELVNNTESERIGDLSLQIMVSYRDDVQLRPISSSANSGGEKMCCTMLFCFSLLLEEERMPPFVFVDELNQGLDPENELKIMTIMFEDAEKETAPQSFVVSPKLLLNLPFHSQTKTHIIFNGSVSKRDVVAPMPAE